MTKPSQQEEPKFIEPDNKLKRKIGDVFKEKPTLTEEELNNANKVIAENAGSFFEEAKGAIAMMQEALENHQEYSFEEFRTKMSEGAFEIKSRAGTFGYTLASDVAKSLYDYLEKINSTEAIVISVLTNHVNALKAIILGKIAGNGEKMGQELMAGLSELVKKVK